MLLVQHAPPSLQRPAAGRAPGVPLVCAAFGASRSQRAEHVPVPIARRDPPPAFHGLRRDVRRARHLCVPHPARHNRSEPSTSPCRSRLVTPHTPAMACGGMCAGRATCVCRIRRDAIAASLAPCRSRHASPQPPATAGGETCAWSATCVCRTQRVAIAAVRARPRADRASRVSRPPIRQPRPAAGCAPGAPLVSAAPSASQPQRAEHVTVPLVLRDRSPPAKAYGGTCAGRATCVCRIRRVEITASRARPRDAGATRAPARLPRPEVGCAPTAPLGCAAPGASRPQRD